MPSHGPKLLLRWWRIALVSLGAAILTMAALWYLVHRSSWAGPLLANALRAVIGTNAVAKLEDRAYQVEDRVNRWRRRNEKPHAHWTVPAPSSSVGSASRVAELSPFSPPAPGPVHKSWSAPGDGQWVEVPDPRRPVAPIMMLKTLLHPDAQRSWAELFVIAIDLRQAELHSMPGTREPAATSPLPPSFKRPGRIPVEDQLQLVGAFNGGFMAEHGHYGMRVFGQTLIEPRPRVCTIAMDDHGNLEIATWAKIEPKSSSLKWFRQTPACMVESGTMHVGLKHGQGLAWGATLDGDTVIRRSAIGLDASRQVLFVGITNHTTARALAEGMHHAGANDVAQLDVNWSYPKFLIYQRKPEGGLLAKALMDGFEYSPDEYVSKPSLRDFFYLTRKTRTEPRLPPTPPCPSCQK